MKELVKEEIKSILREKDTLIRQSYTSSEKRKS